MTLFPDTLQLVKSGIWPVDDSERSHRDFMQINEEISCRVDWQIIECVWVVELYRSMWPFGMFKGREGWVSHAEDIGVSESGVVETVDWISKTKTKLEILIL